MNWPEDMFVKFCEVCDKAYPAIWFWYEKPWAAPGGRNVYRGDYFAVYEFIDCRVGGLCAAKGDGSGD